MAWLLHTSMRLTITFEHQRNASQDGVACRCKPHELHLMFSSPHDLVEGRIYAKLTDKGLNLNLVASIGPQAGNALSIVQDQAA